MIAMENIPEGIIEEILLNLSLKSLVRFRCVSKSWLSLISNQHFAKLHFRRSSQHTHRILCTVSLETRSLDMDASLHDDSAVVQLDFPTCGPSLLVRIMGSCRGFLLLVLEYDSKLSLWNPSTGVFKQIPQSPLWNYVFLYGFGYDESTGDYLVVAAAYDPNASVSVTDVHVFSLRINSWEKLALNCPYINLMDDPRDGSILNGAIHWLALHIDEPQLSRGAIIAFDLKERSLQEVPMPDDFNDEFCDLKVLGGCLGLIDMNNAYVTEIWVMREYGVKSSWTKHITVSLLEIPTNYFLPICFTKDGGVVGVDGGRGLVKYNDKGELLEHREYIRGPLTFGIAASVYTETLLSLDGDHGKMVEEQNKQW